MKLKSRQLFWDFIISGSFDKGDAEHKLVKLCINAAVKLNVLFCSKEHTTGPTFIKKKSWNKHKHINSKNNKIKT